MCRPLVTLVAAAAAGCMCAGLRDAGLYSVSHPLLPSFTSHQLAKALAAPGRAVTRLPAPGSLERSGPGPGAARTFDHQGDPATALLPVAVTLPCQEEWLACIAEQGSSSARHAMRSELPARRSRVPAAACWYDQSTPDGAVPHGVFCGAACCQVLLPR